MARVRRGDVLREIPALYRSGERFDLVFLDPPYDGRARRPWRRSAAAGCCSPRAWVVAQHFTKQKPPQSVGVLASFRTRRFGETTLTFFRAAGLPS